MPENNIFDSDDSLHAAFVEHCNKCDCPMGCIHRQYNQPSTMLDTRCASILKCFARFVVTKKEERSEVSTIKMRRALPNPPPKRLNRVTRRLEDATRRFLNYLSYCKSARSGNFFECKDWMHEISDELCALCAHYNTINDNRKHKGKGGVS